MSLVWKIRLLLWGALALGLLFIAYRAIVPFGTITYVQDFEDDGFFIATLTPADRVSVADGQAVITGDPAYFSLRTPRPFDRAEVTVTFRNQSDLPVVEAGVLMDKTAWRYDLQPLGNRYLDQLALVWPGLRAGKTLLLRREPGYASIAAFLASPPPLAAVATYNFQLPLEFRLPDYAPADRPAALLPHPLRGGFRFFTYVRNEPLDTAFTVVDRNADRDPDPVEVSVSVNGQVIQAVRLEDDGVATDSRIPAEPRSLRLTSPAMPEGAYLIELTAGSDILTTGIEAAFATAAFLGPLDFDRAASGSITLVTNSRRVQAVTTHPDRLQTIAAGTARLTLDETYRQFETVVPRPAGSSTVPLVLAEDGIRLSGDGVFAFTGAAWFDPRPKRVDRNLDPADPALTHIIADYVPPAERDGFQTAVAGFDLAGAYRENGAYNFILSIPGLRADDTASDSVIVDSIAVTVKGKTVLETLKSLYGKQ